MKTSALIKYLVTGALLFQVETVLGNNSGKTAPKPQTQLSPTTAAVYEKVFKQLTSKKSQFNKETLQKLGPGVTGGGDSCEQKLAYSYAFLLQLIEKDKIPASEFNADKNQLLASLNSTKFAFDYNLEKGRPVEALNVPAMNAILLDRTICNNDYEPLSYYAPLLMHEALRLAGRNDDDKDYAISKKYVGVIRREADIEINNKRSFRIMSKTAGGTMALAWGVQGEPLDFEKFDSLPSEEQYGFVMDNYDRLENYLIDLKRMRIVAVVGDNTQCGSEGCGPEVNLAFAEFEKQYDYNHISFAWHVDPVSNIGMRIQEVKWDRWVDGIFAMDENQRLVGSCQTQCEDIIEAAIQKALTKTQKKQLDEFSRRNNYYRIKDLGKGSHWELTIDADNMKEDGSMYLRAPMKLEFVNGQIKVTLGAFKQLSKDQIRNERYPRSN